MFDDIELVTGPLGYAAGGIAAAHVEVKHAVCSRRGPEAHIAGRVACQVHHPGQFDITDGETHRDADAYEQDFDRGRGV